jgi:hypothetical protein
MDGVLLAQRRTELTGGMAGADTCRSQVVDGLESQTAVEEILDLQLLAGIPFPEVVGFQNDTRRPTFIVPAGEEQPASPHR